LALFIDTKHDRVLRRSEVNAYDIREFFNKLRIPGQFESFGSMWLKLMILPNALDRVLAHLLNLGHGPRAPVSRPFGFGLKSRFYNARDILSFELRFASTPWSNIPYTANALVDDPPAPESDGTALNTQSFGNLLVLLALSGEEKQA